MENKRFTEMRKTADSCCLDIKSEFEFKKKHPQSIPNPVSAQNERQKNEFGQFFCPWLYYTRCQRVGNLVRKIKYIS